MKLLKLDHPPIYPVNPWQVSEHSFSLKRNLLSETLFALANGYIGIRGSFEEGLTDASNRSIDGIYLNGFYESVPIPQAERGYGFARNSQTMLNVANSKMIELYLEDERFSLNNGNILRFKRTLNMKEGFQARELVWRSPQGREIKLVVRRIVPFKQRHLIAFEYQVEPLNFSGTMIITSSLDGNVDNHTHVENDPRFSASLGDLRLATTKVSVKDTGALLIQETKRSQLTLACAMENEIVEGRVREINREKTGEKASLKFIIESGENEKVVLAKYAAYFTSRDYPLSELPTLAQNMVVKAKKIGFQNLMTEQKEYCRKYWDRVGIAIKGDPEVEQGLRFNLFHLLQACGNNGQTSIAAKGLTSEGYDGHYFWDTEIYMVPFYAYTKPQEARKLLEFRYSILDHARNRARELSHPRGALYPWRTIAGEEGSSYFPAGTAQYHINAAIAYAISKYIQISGDNDFLLEHGAEIIFETARLWEDLGTYVPRKGNRFCFNEVTGPDEYSALVNNNCYTNLMAQWHLRYAYETAQNIKQNYIQEYQQLAKKIKLKEDELHAWMLAAEYMYIPYDEVMQIHPQDDGFLEKEVWDFSATPINKYPLLLHYHPLVIYRYQVCKQPDVILAHLLLEDRFNLEQKRHDFNYYEPITTHDSSLSPSIFSIVSSELGYREDAYHFFSVSTRLDLDNIMKASHYGVHMANMAGSWLCLANGFAGMRIKAGELSFDPYLPHNLQHYRFRINYLGFLLEVFVKDDHVNYKLLEGDKISFIHRGEEVTLTGGSDISLMLSEQKE